MTATDEMENHIKNFFKNWKDQSPTVGDCNIDPMMIYITQKFLEKLHNLENSGPTAKLWVQYLRSVIILLQFVEAERLGDWDLHLSSVKEMLPIFHASGHFSYAKCAQWYLQDMANLEAIMDPIEFERFTKEGYFTIRRTDKAWSGVWSDMCIEQTLNRFFGTDLKHGRGVTPSVVSRYLLGMPSAFDVMECLEEYADLRTANSEQHVDLSQSRMRRDKEDIGKFVFWLDHHNPFEKRDSLMSLSTGVMGAANINCHMAFEEGRKGMETMKGKNLANITLSSKFKVKNLCDGQNKIRVPGDSSAIDPSALLQRIAVLYKNDESKKKEAISFELSPYPLSLFDELGLMRKSVKSELYKLFSTHPQSQSLLTNMVYVIDGGWLLHQVFWPHSKKFVDILEIYRSFIVNKFGGNCRVVFDGYSNEIIGIKSYERFRRKEKFVAPDVEISEDKMVTITQKKFLSNVANKYKFIILLSKYLQNHNIEVNVAEEDADVDIVMKGITLKESISEPVAVVGNDVDLFILLIALTPDHSNMFLFKIVPGSKGNTLYSTSQHREFKPFILFAHAFSGCDSTSAMYNNGKKR
ncbi:uncharacterized protein LOC123316535 [Coccinella septempunctata]|uniref:uncharacterized protein LOC123316535 n=1 Tax=Coccinella septempunctata TaxID=41139 RepID=UPI001D05D03C|nr:uncharacterized protein LOC123316535 [Coccinella septempunctata]